MQALQNLTPFESETTEKADLGMTKNFELMFWDCYRGFQFPSRKRCAHVAVLTLCSPNRVNTGHIGRPSLTIKEETFLVFPLCQTWSSIISNILLEIPQAKMTLIPESGLHTFVMSRSAILLGDSSFQFVSVVKGRFGSN